MKRVLSLSLLLILGACSSGGRQNVRTMNGLNSSVPSLAGGRIGAVITTQDDCSALTGPQYEGQSSSASTVYRGQSDAQGTNGLPSSSNSGISTRGGNASWGTVQLLAIYENEMRLVGTGLTDQRRTTTVVSSGVSGFASYGQVRLPGIRTGTAGSQIAFTPDGSSLLITRTEESSVSLINVGDKGRLGSHYQINTGQHPSEVATSMTPWGGMAAVVNDLGVDLIAFDRLSHTGSAVGRPYYSLPFGSFAGRPTSVAFVPGDSGEGSEFIAISVSSTRGQYNTNGGRVLLCDLAKYNESGESPWETANRGQNGSPRGCYEFNQFSPNVHSPQSRVVGTPIKLAMGNSLAVALSEGQGPILLNTSQYPTGAFNYPSDLGSGRINTFGQNPALRRGYVDIALHPLSENVMVLEKQRLVTYAMDNFFDVGQMDGAAIQIAKEASALAVDSGPNPNFALVADKGQGRVAIARINGRQVSHNSYSDFIQLNACPIDVAIRTARSFRSPPAVPQPTANSSED